MRWLVVVIVFVLSLLLLISCSITQEQYDAVKDEITSLHNEASMLQSDLTSLQEENMALNENLRTKEQTYTELETDFKELQVKNKELRALQVEFEELQADYQKTKSLQAEFENLQDDYQNLLERSKQSTLSNPSWLELKSFLEQDDTDTLTYDKTSFDCDGFAITLRDRALPFGYRCAFIGLSFGEVVGHALNAFETTDRGIIFVDATEHDTIAYVQQGQPYGMISLDVVKSDYINCEGDPNSFWYELSWESHANPFSYDYYVTYQKRQDFLHQSIDAFNKAVIEYNSGSTKWSHSQLDKWSKNLDSLEQDVGSIRYETMGVVRNIEIYWN
jgi:hypothetical protein